MVFEMLNGLKEALFTPFPDSSLWGSSYCHIDAVVNPCLTYLDGDGVMRRSIVAGEIVNSFSRIFSDSGGGMKGSQRGI